MTTYGNFDAGKADGIKFNPYLDQPLKPVKAEAGYDFGFKIDKAAPAWGVEKTTGVTPEERVGEVATKTYATVSSLHEEADKDRMVDEFFSVYITPESRERMASTSFNAGMIMGAFDDVIEQLV